MKSVYWQVKSRSEKANVQGLARESVRAGQISCSLCFSRYALVLKENRRSVNNGFCNDVLIFTALTKFFRLQHVHFVPGLVYKPS